MSARDVSNAKLIGGPDNLDGKLIVVLRPYRVLATVPHAFSLMLTCLLGRLQMPAIPIVLTFLIVDWTGSYTIGGVVGGVLTVGQGVAGPLRGRAADRHSASKLLVITALCYATGLGLVTMCAYPAGVLPVRYWWVILPVAFLTGLALPPVTQIGRSIWPRITDRQALQAAYAVEATMQEILFIAAPILAASAVAFYNPVVATLGCAAWGLVGPALFAVVLRRAKLDHPPGDSPNPLDSQSADQRTRSTSLLRMPGVARLLLFNLLLVGGLAGTDLVLVGWARDEGNPGLAGILAAVWAVGSLIGGLLFGASAKRPRLWLRAAFAALGLYVLVPFLPPVADPASPLLVGAILTVGGMAIAPTLAANNSRISEIVPPQRHGEAFGWLATAATSGIALSSPIVGSLLDAAGPAAATAATGGLTVLAVILVAHRSVTGSPLPVSKEHSVTA